MMVDPSVGKEVRSFFGHCNIISSITPLGNGRFVSVSDDSSMRVWDIRSKDSIQKLSSNRLSVTSTAGNDSFLFFGYHNSSIGAVDLRNAPAKPYMVMSTQVHIPELLGFSKSCDSISMIGLQSKDTIRDSTIFVEDDGFGSKKVLRLYPKITPPV